MIVSLRGRKRTKRDKDKERQTQVRVGKKDEENSVMIDSFTLRL